jgi:hypothetical protein
VDLIVFPISAIIISTTTTTTRTAIIIIIIIRFIIATSEWLFPLLVLVFHPKLYFNHHRNHW